MGIILPAFDGGQKCGIQQEHGKKGCDNVLWMRARPWHDWVIVLSILALTAIGVAAIWGEDIASLFRDPPAESAGEGANGPAAPPGGTKM